MFPLSQHCGDKEQELGRWGVGATQGSGRPGEAEMAERSPRKGPQNSSWVLGTRA